MKAEGTAEPDRRKKIGFIGCGRVGSALALLLQQAGYEVVGVASRRQTSAEILAERLGCPAIDGPEVARRADALFLTTSDDAVATVSDALAGVAAFHDGQIVLHLSGALTSEALAPAAAQGAITLSLHPIQSFASVEQAIAILPGSYFSIEGDSRGYDFAREVVARLKGQSFLLDSGAKVLYHVACVAASNYFVGLLASSLDLLEEADIPEEMRLPALLPLVAGTLNNIRTLGIPQALTGPIARGDAGTLEKHLTALEGLPEQLRIYLSLGLKTVDVARAKGTITPEQAKDLRLLLMSHIGRIEEKTPAGV
ncbi:MAG: DUF2520 domain-containing protein [Thermacetogeniaceae bacterium]|jgi:predicted short-subunit dehydrogenase-like oxidoreductase (DUF2520 family)